MIIVYKITNLINNKSYIGYTKKSLDARWQEHQNVALREKTNRKFYNAIRKYGTSCWDAEILLETETHKDATDQEIFFIKKFNTFNKGYNATLGGDGNHGIKMSKKSNMMRSLALKGKSKSPETIEKFKRKILSETTKNKISIAHKGKKKPWVKWNKNQIKKRALTRRGLNKEQYNLIYNYRKQGLLIREIAEKMLLTTDLVKKWLKKDWELN